MDKYLSVRKCGVAEVASIEVTGNSTAVLYAAVYEFADVPTVEVEVVWSTDPGTAWFYRITPDEFDRFIAEAIRVASVGRFANRVKAASVRATSIERTDAYQYRSGLVEAAIATAEVEATIRAEGPEAVLR
jgi:hypothetical protein